MNSYRHSSAAGRPHSSTPTSVQPSVAGLGDEHLCSGCRVSGSFTVGRSRSDRSRQQPERGGPTWRMSQTRGVKLASQKCVVGGPVGLHLACLVRASAPLGPDSAPATAPLLCPFHRVGLTPKISFGEKGLRTQTQKANCSTRSTHAASGLTAQTTARGTWEERGSVVLPHTHCLQDLEGQQVGCAE